MWSNDNWKRAQREGLTPTPPVRNITHARHSEYAHELGDRMRPDSITRKPLVEMHCFTHRLPVVLRADLPLVLPLGLPVFDALRPGCMHFVRCWFSMRYIFGLFYCFTSH